MFWRKKPAKSRMTKEAKRRQQFAIWDYYRKKNVEGDSKPFKKK